jgi:hypothetical protein
LTEPAAPGADEDRRLSGLLAGRRVLFCYGLFGEVIAGLRPLGQDYMGSQIDWLRRIAVAAEVVALPTAAPVGVNAGRIAAALAADAPPALVVAHSKGGLEALAALLRPRAAARCHGFIALQSPFWGSPVADAVCARRSLRIATHHALRLAHLGTGRGLKDLTTPVRTTWMNDHTAAIQALSHQVPMVTLATVLDRQWHWQDRAYWPLARWMERQGAGENDGLVPVSSTRLPGVPCLVSSGGHRALVATGPGRDPVGVLRGLLLAMLGDGGYSAATSTSTSSASSEAVISITGSATMPAPSRVPSATPFTETVPLAGTR